MLKGFADCNWIKPKSIFLQYYDEQLNSKRTIWTAYFNNNFAGYITLKWQSDYEFFDQNNIPEINDFNVLPTFRRLGIGLKLLQTAEAQAFITTNIVGLRVGLYGGENGEGYGAAQKLYIKRGYIPDGRGITYQNKYVDYGQNIILDDDLILWFLKKNDKF